MKRNKHASVKGNEILDMYSNRVELKSISVYVRGIDDIKCKENNEEDFSSAFYLEIDPFTVLVSAYHVNDKKELSIEDAYGKAMGDMFDKIQEEFEIIHVE